MTAPYDSGHAPCGQPAFATSDSSETSGFSDVAGALSGPSLVNHRAVIPSLNHRAVIPSLNHGAVIPPLDTGTLLRLRTLWPQIQQDSLRQNLVRWQCQALADTLGSAITHCLFYKERLGQQEVMAAISRLKQVSSAPEPMPEKALCSEHLLLMGTILSTLPFTYPSDLAADTEQFMAVGHDDVEAAVSVGTSGTTGPSKRIFATQTDLQASIDFFRYGMRYLLRPGVHEKVALLMSGTREGSVGDLLGRALAADGLECEVCGFPETEESMLRHLMQVRPTCIVGVPAQIYAMARHGLAASLRPFVHTVLLSGDTAVPSLRKAIAEAFECEVFLHYGLTEIGLGGFVECPAHHGCHGRELDLFIEIIDEQGHTYVPPAKGATPYGEIVITTLTRKAMPLLRYRTGDIGRLIITPCVCGSALWRLDPRGRGTGVSGVLLPPRLMEAGQRMQNLPEGGTSPTLEYETVQNALYSLPWVRDFRVITHDAGAKIACFDAVPVVDTVPVDAGVKAVPAHSPASARLYDGAPDEKNDDCPVHVVFALCPVAEEKDPERARPETLTPESTAAKAATEEGAAAEAKKALGQVLCQLEQCGVCAHIVITAEGSALRQRLFPAMVTPKKLLEHRDDAFSCALYGI